MNLRSTLAVVLSLTSTASCALVSEEKRSEEDTSIDEAALREPSSIKIPSELPFPNAGGFAATFSTQGDGRLDLSNAFHTPQGTNKRSCGTCHLPSDGWSLTPLHIEAWFHFTGGTHPLFIAAEANSPTADLSTVEARYASYSMLRKGLFRRGGAAPAVRDYDIVAAEDPYGFGSAAAQRFSIFRRPLATSNLQATKNVHWDDVFTMGGRSVRQGLAAQTEANIKNAQAGIPLPETVSAIVDYESSLSIAQSIVWGVGRLDSCGARGGPRNHAAQPPTAGRFDLYDAWGDGASPGCASPARAAIARGQALFNTKTNARGGTCNGCHNAANDGSNVKGAMFDIGVSGERWASIDGLPIYTVRNRGTGEEIRTTDPGKAHRTGKWSDMNRFKVPSLRGLTARAPFFHNGIAKNLHDVVHVYEATLGFDFTDAEENDLVAFLNAL